MRKRYFILIALLLGVSSGCSKYRPPAHLPSNWQSPVSEGMSACSPRCYSWWKGLNDPELCSLMRRASRKNFDLLLARKSKGEDSCSTWMTLSADVAKSYCELRSLQIRLELIDKHIVSQQETLRLTQSLMTSGFVGTIDLNEAEEFSSQLKAQKPLIQASIYKTIYHLSVLLGQCPGGLCRELITSCALPALPCQMPIGCPADYLKRRLQGCKAGRKTPCKITPTIGYYLLEKSAIEALEQVENSLTALYFFIQNQRELEAAYQKSREAYQQIYQLYERGLKSYLEVLVIQRSMLAAENAYVEGRLQLLSSYIDLYTALYI